ncbi:MAG: LTA synthase family protein [Lachnospiraceae bacterium]|nr:LTA synthase family protein [Lachnospiraceae bacterium]
MKKEWIKQYAPMVIKYGISLVLMLLVWNAMHVKKYLLGSVLELLVIALLSNMLLVKPLLGNVINGLLLLFFNIQQAVLLFGTTYVSTVMLSNLASIEDLQGKAGIYIGASLLVLVITFLPVKRVEINKAWEGRILSLVLAAFLFLTFALTGAGYTPYSAYLELIRDEREMRKEASVSTEEAKPMFYKEGIYDGVSKPAALSEKPNIILIFTEGVSQNIPEDPRQIMPNLLALEEKSLYFNNYFNHTFATYRGLIGQLYSGYQHLDMEDNGLISLQQILKEQGYATAFINTEPNNADFTDYLSWMDFDRLLGKKEDIQNGQVDYLSDKEAYELLYETCLEQEKEQKPFFTAIYTFGTHATLDSVDEKFGDGSDSELNKFYDVDYQLGVFLEKFENSPLADDTLLVFTGDHCTYQDYYFDKAFPDYVRKASIVDEMPLLFYYKGMKPEKVNVFGRNSLDMAPTLLDYLDITAPNYFLGTSLFDPEPNAFDTLENEENYYVMTKYGIIEHDIPDEEKEWFSTQLQYYRKAKQGEHIGTADAGEAD